MKKVVIKRVAPIVLFCFVSLLIGDSLSVTASPKSEAWELLERGETLYRAGYYPLALEYFLSAKAAAAKGENQERLLLDIALVHFALGDNEKCSEALSMFLDDNPEKKLDRDLFPKGFLQVYGQTQLLFKVKKAEQKRTEDKKQAEEQLTFKKEESQAGKKETAQLSVQEKEKPVPHLKKKKKFPLLMVILGVGVVVILIVLLTKKKKQNLTLNVTVGEGVTGNPGTGSYTYSKGDSISYSYSLSSSIYKDLSVLLDGNTVAASGNITMNSNHTLSVSAIKIIATYSNGVLMVGGVRYELASIPAGTFKMGSNSSEAYSDEKPVHTVRISKGFWMGKTEVTQGLWQAVMGSNPSYFPKGSTYPVEQVSWNDCQSFIQTMNQMLGGNAFRMPTEAEWEYACRAGTTSEYYGNVDAIAWYKGNSRGSTHPVGQKQANAFRLYDMSGNVWEWCQDWYGTYSAGYQVDPTGPASGSYRVDCGGGWANNAKDVRSANRTGSSTLNRGIHLGFRLARTNE